MTEQKVIDALAEEVEAQEAFVALLLAGALIFLVNDDLFGLIGKD